MTTTEIHPAIAPQSTDIVVTKRRVSAFSGSDLEVVLRAQNISHVEHHSCSYRSGVHLDLQNHFY
jgi:isochorismate hydrolase